MDPGASNIPVLGVTKNPSNQEVIEQWKTGDTNKIFKTFYPNIQNIDYRTFNTKLRRISDKIKSLKRNKKYDELNNFLDAKFKLPSDSVNEVTDQIQNIHIQAGLDHSQNIKLKRKIKSAEFSNDNLSDQIKNYEQKVDVLMNLLDVTNDKLGKSIKSEQCDSAKFEKDVKQWEEKFKQLSANLDYTTEQLEQTKLKLNKSCTRNVTKRIKRRDESILLKEQIITEKEREIEGMKVVCEEKNEEVKELKREKKTLLVKVCRLRQYKDHSILDKNLDHIQLLKSEIQEKENQIIELEQINAIFQDPTINSFNDGKYSNEIRSTIMALITECGVSQKKVNHVMQTVLQNLTGKTLSRLPSTGVRSRLMLEAKRVAQCQVAEAMLQNWDNNPTHAQKGNTIHQDGTSKFHRHFQSFQVTTATGTTLSAGLTEVARGDSGTIVTEFKDIVSDLANTISSSTSGNHNKDVAKLVTSIMSTMSDQGSVNPVFNESLKTIREDLLPVAYDHWDTLSADTKEEMGKLLSFFCKMHIFVNMAGETDKCLAQFEKHITAEGRNPFSFNWTESGASRLVRTVSKAFTSHGCEKSGVASHFLTFLTENGTPNKLVTFRGHRFNHLFYAAGATYFHLGDTKNFLQKWSDPNDLLKSIRFDIDESVYISGVRALGIIDKVVTGPFWRLIEAAPNVLALNNKLYQLKLQLEKWSQDAGPVLHGETAFSEDEVSIHKDIVYECLLASSDNPVIDTYTQMALELCFGGMLLILERQAKDQLPGGRYWDLDQTVLDRMSAVPTTNTVSERDFAQLDMLMRAKPSASTVAFESVIMWSNNKTSAWLSSLPDDQYEQVLDDARRNAPHLARQIKLKQQTLYAGKLQHLKEKQEKKAKQEEKTHSTKVRLTNKITESGGLWSSDQQFQDFQSQHSESVYKDALISQIYFRKSVLGSKGPKELFQQQHKGNVFTVGQLEDNLRQILALNDDDDVEVDEPGLSYLPTQEVSNVVTNLKSQLKVRIQEGRKKIIVSQQRNQLPHFITNPLLLEGKRVKHKCRDPDTKEIEWYSGVVLHIAKPHVNHVKTEYTIKYDDDTDEWIFPLLRDFENGDLIIIE